MAAWESVWSCPRFSTEKAGACTSPAVRKGTNAQRAIQTIQAALPSPSANASLAFLHLDLSDLTTIKIAVAAFQSQESTLHILFNNAGVSQAP